MVHIEVDWLYFWVSVSTEETNGTQIRGFQRCEIFFQGLQGKMLIVTESLGRQASGHACGQFCLYQVNWGEKSHGNWGYDHSLGRARSWCAHNGESKPTTTLPSLSSHCGCHSTRDFTLHCLDFPRWTKINPFVPSDFCSVCYYSKRKGGQESTGAHIQPAAFKANWSELPEVV